MTKTPLFIITHYTLYGSRSSIETDQDWHDIVGVFEDMWDYVQVKDENGQIIYKTIGLDRFKERMRLN